MERTFPHAPLVYSPHPSLGLISSDSFPSTASGTLNHNMEKAPIPEPLPGLNSLISLPARDSVRGSVKFVFRCE